MATGPPLSAPNPRDLFLSRDLSEADARQYLQTRGFRDPESADRLLQQLADDLPTCLALGNLAERLLDCLIGAPDPNAALVWFCRYVTTRAPRASLLTYFHDDPRALQIITHLLGASPFLSEVLIWNPEYFSWLQRALEAAPPDDVDYRAELDRLITHNPSFTRQLDALKRFKRREMLQIAARDLLGKDTL